MSYSGISINEDDTVEQIIVRVKSLPAGWGFYLNPVLNKERTGQWKPTEKEKFDLMLKVIQAMSETTIKDHVKGVVKFQYFRDNQLFYKTETGLVFPVPIEDIGNATFLAEDRAMLFMRYIRKFMQTVEEGKA